METNNFLLNSNTALNELQFSIVASMCRSDISCIYRKLMLSGLDDSSLGFWVWDIANNLELYSPSFRASLQYVGTSDFPDVPESWQKAIFPEDLATAITNFNEHVATKGERAYLQRVRYNRKIKGTLTVVCHGKVIAWEGDAPKVMVGVHLPEDGLFKTKKIKSRILLQFNR